MYRGFVRLASFILMYLLGGNLHDKNSYYRI